MKKANKILMASVAILLSLVLITTSVVSGVFAKFAIRKNTTTTMKLEKFGVTMEVSAPTTYASIVANKTVNDGQNVSVTLSDVIMEPDDFTTLGCLQFKFSGLTTVITNLKVWVDIELSEKFYIPASAFPEYPNATGKAYMPIMFYARSFLNGEIKGNAYSTTVWKSATGATSQEAVNNLEQALEKELTEELYKVLSPASYISDVDPTYQDPLVAGLADGNGYYARKTFAAGQPILCQWQADGLSFYFRWQYSGSTEYTPEFAAYIADNFTENDVPIKMTIVVSLEQAQ